MNLIIMAGMWKEISFPGIMMYMKPVVRLYILQRNLYIGGDTYVIDFLDPKDELMGADACSCN